MELLISALGFFFLEHTGIRILLKHRNTYSSLIKYDQIVEILVIAHQHPCELSSNGQNI